MPILLGYLSKLLTSAKSVMPLLLSALTTFGKLLLLKMPRLPIFAHVLIILISVIVGYRIGLISTPEIRTEIVERTVTVVEVREVWPVIPECAGFDFDGNVGGMPLNEFIAWSADLYRWAAGCSNAHYERNKLNEVQ